MALRIAEAPRRRALRRSSRLVLAAAVLLLLLGAVLTPGTRVPTFVGHAYAAGGGGGGGHGGTSVVNATLNMTDQPAFDPSDLLVASGTILNLSITNLGSYNHSFTLVNRPNFILNESWTPGELNAYFSANGSQVDVNVAPGGVRNVSLTFSDAQAGFSYEFVSVVPFQFQAGMFGFLNVTGAPSGPGIVANVSASSTAFAWLPPAIEIDTTAFPVTVDMQITNAGSNAHTFELAAQPNVTLLSGNFTTYFTQHPPAAFVNVPSSPGTVAWANFTLSKPGIYEYICTIPGHFTGGMYGYMYVGVAAPATEAPPSTEIVSEWVLVGGALLLGLGGLLAAAALLVGRFPRGPPTGGH